MENLPPASELARVAEERFGERIRELRQAAGISQADLARRMTASGFNMHQTQIAKIEKGTRSTPVGELTALAAVLGVPPSGLLEHDHLIEISMLDQQLAALDFQAEQLRKRRDQVSRGATKRENGPLWPR